MKKLATQMVLILALAAAASPQRVAKPGRHVRGALPLQIEQVAAPSDVTRVLPAASTWRGEIRIFKKIDAGPGIVKILPARGETIEGHAMILLAIQYDYVQLYSDGDGVFVAGGRP